MAECIQCGQPGATPTDHGLFCADHCELCLVEFGGRCDCGRDWTKEEWGDPDE